MGKGSIRRAQLIAPFGVGAMSVVRDGTATICCGLDHWFKNEDDGSPVKDISEFQINEWRLQRQLKVSYFLRPPDHRRPPQNAPPAVNSNLTVPFLRFPRWHFCSRCRQLSQQHQGAPGRLPCFNCRQKGRRATLAQVPFIAICANGHLQDFPWNEWAHRSASPQCTKPLKLIATGGASLASQRVTCDCGAKRNLGRITEAKDDKTFLSSALDESGQDFLCTGMQPWHNNTATVPCNLPLKGSLRSASNVYFADIKSSIYIPRGTREVPAKLIALMEMVPISTYITVLRAVKMLSATTLRQQCGKILEPFSDSVIEAGLNLISAGSTAPSEDKATVTGDDPLTSFRREEFNVLTTRRNEDMLTIRDTNLADYEKDISKYLSGIWLIETLRETRVLAGFTRIFPDNTQTLEERKQLLWRDAPSDNESWLPGYDVYGEGIFISLNEQLLAESEWVKNAEKRIRLLNVHVAEMRKSRDLPPRILSPRFVLTHTLSHLIINRLTFECGYSSASLRERLYVSDNPKAPMAGVLIYTAAGDAEGTMGGLVRMGKPGSFEPLLRRAVETSRWCSSDPVCMEIGGTSGQGPSNCNLAACHSCALIPETACEEFNRYLDRGLLIGGIANPNNGFFKNLGI